MPVLMPDIPDHAGKKVLPGLTRLKGNGKIMISKNLINVGLVSTYNVVVLSDSENEVYVPAFEYSEMRLSKGMNDAEIMAIA